MYRFIINFPYEHCNLMQFLGHVRDISQSFSTTPSSTSKSARAHCLEALNVGRPAIARGYEFWMCHGHQNLAEGWNGFCPKMMHRCIQFSWVKMAVQDVLTFNQGFFWLLSHFPTFPEFLTKPNHRWPVSPLTWAFPEMGVPPNHQF